MAATPSLSLSKVVAVVAAVFIGVPLVRSASREPETTPPRVRVSPARRPSEQQDASGYCVERFLSPFERRTGMEGSVLGHDARLATVPSALAVEPSSDRGWPSSLARARHALCTSLGELELESFVALVPDPVESGLSYQSEMALQALEGGMTATLAEPGGSFLRDESWLPWDDRRVSPEQRIRSESCRTSTPGVVLFRQPNRSGRSRLSVMLLVGENPVSGPNRGALDRALSAAASFRGSSCRGEQAAGLPPGKLRILGPTFSGSAWSLRSALEHSDLWTEFSGAEIVSGTASDPQIKDYLTSGLTTFSRTTPNEGDLTCAFYNYAFELGARESVREVAGEKVKSTMTRVAMLIEDRTGFGAAAEKLSERELRDEAHRQSSNTRELQSDLQRCAVEAGLQLRFPLGIGTLRDAYEESEHDSGSSGRSDTAFVHQTNLELSLRDTRHALNLEAEPSQRLRNARDVALARILSEISRSGVQFAGIEATDIADAMFLARKVRDVAPDVRLAFFETDALLIHPREREALLGSLVFSPYPFLGDSEFGWGPSVGRRMLFESDLSLGIYNATLALRGRPAHALREYLHARDALLPVWISAIGRGGFVPLTYHARKSPQPTEPELLYGEREVLASTLPQGLPAHLTSELEPRLPRSFAFVFLCTILLAIWDFHLRRREQLLLGVRVHDRIKNDASDHDWDLDAIRAKHYTHCVIRACTISYVAVYMASAQRGLAGTGLEAGLCHAIMLSAGGTLALAGFSCAQLARNLYDFWRATRNAEREAVNAKRRAMQGHIRRLLISTCGIGAVALCILIWAAIEHLVPSAIASASVQELQAPIAQQTQLMLFSIRAVSLGSGLSPITPMILCTLVMYLWSRGRSARLCAAYEVAGMSPPDAVPDGVSTPITAILYPMSSLLVDGRASLDNVGDRARAKRREGLVADERDMVMAIVHPISGAARIALGLFVGSVPFVAMFVFKRPSSPGPLFETCLLFAWLCTCVTLILLVLIQFGEYWRALENMLKRITEHPIGRSLHRIQPFARDHLSDLVARKPAQALRLAACARLAQTLIESAPATLRSARPDNQRHLFLADHDDAQREHDARASRAPRCALNTHRAEVLRLPVSSQEGSVAVMRLGLTVFQLACAAMELLEAAWEGTLTQGRPPGKGRVSAPIDQLGAWALSYRLYSKEEWRWLQDLESFVATVIATMVTTYVRQFRYFVYSSTGCALLLLLAVSSYAFEPARVLMTSMWLIVLAVVSFTVFVYVGLDRNTLLSHISGSQPDVVRIDSGLVLRSLTWVAFPLLCVVIAQYPTLANALFVIIEPIWRVLR